MVENWKKVEGYPYYVSDLGRIRSCNTNKIKMLRLDKDGYPKVTLHNNGKRKTFNVHRLVANAFIKNPKRKPQVNHISGNKFDNAASNLEWVTGKENIEHAIRIGLIKTKDKVVKVNKDPKWRKRKVRIIETGQCFSSIVDCANAINGRTRGVSEVLGGRKKSHRGLHFEYIT